MEDEIEEQARRLFLKLQTYPGLDDELRMWLIKNAMREVANEAVERAKK